MITVLFSFTHLLLLSGFIYFLHLLTYLCKSFVLQSKQSIVSLLNFNLSLIEVFICDFLLKIVFSLSKVEDIFPAQIERFCVTFKQNHNIIVAISLQFITVSPLLSLLSIIMFSFLFEVFLFYFLALSNDCPILK